MCAPRPAVAQAQARGYDASVDLLWQTTQTYRDGRHGNLLRALRGLYDPALRPLYEDLLGADSSIHRIHGRLGIAEISPEGQMELSSLAQIEDTTELTQVLGAAIDDGLLENADLAQVIDWNVLDLSARQAVAARVVGAGGELDPAFYRQALLAGDHESATASQMLQHAVAGLLLAQAGDPQGLVALGELETMGDLDTRQAIQAQAMQVAVRNEFKAAGPWILELASDENANRNLRFAALSVSLELGVPGSEALWKQMFSQTTSAVEPNRLALLALAAAPKAQPDLYTPLIEHDRELLATIGR